MIYQNGKKTQKKIPEFTLRCHDVMKANLAQNISSRDTEQEQVARNKSDFVYETSNCLYCKILSSPDLEKTRERSIIDKAEEAVSTIYLS